MNWNWIVAIGLALLMAPVEVPAAPTQAPDFARGPSDVAYETVVRRLKPGQNVRVTTGSTRFEMSWVGATRHGVPYHIFDDESGTTFVSGPSDSDVAQWSEIRRIDVRGRATDVGWPIGAAVGAVGGIAAAVAMSQMPWLGGEPSGEGVTGAALVFAAVGALAGGVTGAIIGSAFPKWNAVYKKK